MGHRRTCLSCQCLGGQGIAEEAAGRSAEGEPALVVSKPDHNNPFEVEFFGADNHPGEHRLDGPMPKLVAEQSQQTKGFQVSCW